MPSKTIRDIIEQWHADSFTFIDKIARDQLIVEMELRELELREVLNAVYEDAEKSKGGWLISSKTLQKVEDALWGKAEDALWG